MIHDRNYHRKMNWTKAIRKKKICNDQGGLMINPYTREVQPFEWYNNLHQYSKNKIHCSCPLCRGTYVYKDTNSRQKQSHATIKRLLAMDYIDLDDLAEAAL